MKREITCIICPAGCNITVSGDEMNPEISGNRCDRGFEYARAECICPVRTLTTTVRLSNGKLLPVKTKEPIPKEKIKEAMKIINKTVRDLPVYFNEVIIDNIEGTQLIATKEVK